jgi:hypothetical protein
MGLLSRGDHGQTRSEREQLRDHLKELEALREERLLDLGRLALEMHKQDRISGERLWAAAAEVAALEDEAALVRRGLEQRLTIEQLGELSRQ